MRLENQIYIILLALLILITTVSWRERANSIGRICGKCAYILFVFILVEATCVAGLFISTGELLPLTDYNYNTWLFEPHPYLIAVPRKNVHVNFEGHEIKHNSSGFRDREFPPKTSKKRVLAIGGSTTYGVGVNNDETWPALLEKELGSDYEVFNLGIPAHSTVEHLHLLAFYVPTLQPDIVLLHVGLNDMHVMHAPNLTPDYSNFHAPMVNENLGACYLDTLPKIGMIRVSFIILQKLAWSPICPFQRMNYHVSPQSGVDQAALAYYRQNLNSLLSLLKNQHVKTFLLPQVLAQENLNSGKYQWWTPYIEQSKLVDYLNVYNSTTQEVSREFDIEFVEKLMLSTWNAEEFADASHLNSNGNRHFAKIIGEQMLHSLP